MVRYSFLVRLSHPLLHAGLFRRILDHLIRSCQHIGRNRQTDLLCCFQIDDEFELRWLLHGKIGWVRAFKYLVYVDGGPVPQVEKVHSVKHQTTGVHELAHRVDRWQPVLCCKVDDSLVMRINDGIVRYDQSIDAFPQYRFEYTVEI